VTIRERGLAALARQLGRPRGLPGQVVGRMLNRGNRVVVQRAADALRVDAGETAADLGFGGGFGLRVLLGLVGPTGRVHGVELSDTMLASAHRQFGKAVTAGRLALHHGSLDALPLRDGSVDAAMTVNTLYFVDDPDAVFAELHRVLRPGGRLVVGVGDPAAMARIPVTAHGFRLRPVDELQHSMVGAGLTLRQHLRVGEGEHAFHLLVADSAGAASPG
jgi:SAM-dependent methyltransferase